MSLTVHIGIYRGEEKEIVTHILYSKDIKNIKDDMQNITSPILTEKHIVDYLVNKFSLDIGEEYSFRVSGPQWLSSVPRLFVLIEIG